MTNLGDILVIGLGASGLACARYCAGRIGEAVTSVTVVDAADTASLRARADELAGIGVTVLLGTSHIDGSFDLCVASPGIAPHSPIMTSARSACGRLVSEIEFAFSQSPSPWVAVTGTNGKTTTTALLAHLLNAGGIPARAVGNFGPPAIAAVADADETEVLVAEVSSFQLALTETFHPRAAVLLNITPDHLDWHGSLESYVADKTKVFGLMGEADTAVIDVDDEGSAPFAERVEAQGVTVVRVSRRESFAVGAGIADGVLTLSAHGSDVRLVPAEDLRIRGPHNVSNALAAAAAAHALGVSAPDLAWGLKSFEPIEHRLEPVAETCGAEWFNDSKATNPDAVYKALDSFEGSDLLLLLGGRNKGNDFSALAEAATNACYGVVVFGEAREELSEAFAGADVDVREAAGLAEAVSVAAAIARPASVVVLSPANASFDEFENYEERGREFKRLVRALECGTD